MMSYLFLSKNWQKMVEQKEEEETEKGGILSDKAFLLVQQIAANVVTYCRVAVTIEGGQPILLKDEFYRVF